VDAIADQVVMTNSSVKSKASSLSAGGLLSRREDFCHSPTRRGWISIEQNNWPLADIFPPGFTYLVQYNDLAAQSVMTTMTRLNAYEFSDKHADDDSCFGGAAFYDWAPVDPPQLDCLDQPGHDPQIRRLWCARRDVCRAVHHVPGQRELAHL